MSRVVFIGGAFNGVEVDLKRWPEKVEIAGLRYSRIDDPDTGVFLGAYVGGEPMDDENVPMEAVAMNAEEVVKAAVAWKSSKGGSPVMDRKEWALFDAVEQHGAATGGFERDD